MQHIDPGGCALELAIDRRLYLQYLRTIARHFQGTFVCLDPNTARLRLDFAVAIGAYTTAGAVAYVFGAGHRTGHARAVQNTLPAHLAIKHSPLAGPLSPNDQGLKYAAGLQPAAERLQRPFKNVVDNFQSMWIIL